jgi:hypothetical protein
LFYLSKKVYKFGLENMTDAMVYHFKITSPESRNFHLEMETDSTHTFFDFHRSLQGIAEFESFQLASFFIPDHHGKKQHEVSLLDLGLNAGAYFIMQKTHLSELIKTPDQQIIYTYDLINDRSMNIELTEIVMERNLREPVVTLKKGDAPVQFFGEDQYDPDSVKIQEEEILMDFGILDDYTELYGEMEDF